MNRKRGIVVLDPASSASADYAAVFNLSFIN